MVQNGDIANVVRAGDAFDVEAAIAEFLADPSRTSLELPRMTTGQRKHARKVADQHPGLQCESFGLGAERQLHLFKLLREAPQVAPTTANRVSVKNTFIDDWVSADGECDTAEPAICRSLPPQLSTGTGNSGIQEFLSKLDLSPIYEGVCKFERSGIDGTDSSTNASLSASPLPSSPESDCRELPSFPEGIQVRNTFIHIEETPVDYRSVQSMPHGMFRQSLLEEATAIEAAPLRQPPAPPHPPVNTGPAAWTFVISPGTEVVIHGLTKCPAFNGRSGIVQSLDEESGRYNILVASPSGGMGTQSAKVKAGNLQLAGPPPPPSFAPTFLPEDCGAHLPPTPTRWLEHSVPVAAPLNLTAPV